MQLLWLQDPRAAAETAIAKATIVLPGMSGLGNRSMPSDADTILAMSKVFRLKRICFQRIT
jgi:hypothetical protein